MYKTEFKALNINVEATIVYPKGVPYYTVYGWNRLNVNTKSAVSFWQIIDVGFYKKYTIVCNHL